MAYIGIVCNNEIKLTAATCNRWMNLSNIILNKRNQNQKII